MKYSKEIFYVCLLVCFIVFIDAYKDRTKQQRFTINTSNELLPSIYDARTNKSYMQVPDSSGKPVFYEVGSYARDGKSAKGYTSSELFKVKN